MTLTTQQLHADGLGQIEVYAPDAPPLAASQATTPRYLHDVTAQAFAACGVSPNFNYTSWTRSQQLVQNSQDTVIVPLARTEMRESQYLWIAEVALYQSSFVTLGEPLNSFTDLTPDMLIGVETGTAHRDFLLSHGIDPAQIIQVRSAAVLLELLVMGRIDVWFEGVPEILHIRDQRKDEPALTISAPVHSLHLYLASGLDFPPEAAGVLAACIEDFKHTPAYADLIGAITVGRTQTH